MSKLSRYTQLIFGSTAGFDQLAQFGSFASGSPTYATTPAQVQSLSNYLTGWFGAILGDDSPALEDLNSLCYLFAYQLAYLMQAGVPEYDSATTYYTGSWVQSGGVAYVSIVDGNLGNSVTDATKWGPPVTTSMLQDHCVTPSKLDPTVAIVPSGAMMPFGGASAPGGWLLCNGSPVSRTTYSALFAAIGTTYGVGNGSTTFNLPNMAGNVPMGANGTYPLGTSGGEASHVLTPTEMPSHSHADAGHTHGYNEAGGGGGGADGGSGNGTLYGGTHSATSATGNANIQNTGGDGAHNNLQPYVTFNYIIKF